MMGQLPVERVTSDVGFSRVGVDYAGPLLLKLGLAHKPIYHRQILRVGIRLDVG